MVTNGIRRTDIQHSFDASLITVSLICSLLGIPSCSTKFRWPVALVAWFQSCPRGHLRWERDKNSLTIVALLKMRCDLCWGMTIFELVHCLISFLRSCRDTGERTDDIFAVEWAREWGSEAPYRRGAESALPLPLLLQLLWRLESPNLYGRWTS